MKMGSPFLTKEAYKLAWTDCQGMLVTKLNVLIFGMVLNLTTMKITMLRIPTARHCRRRHPSPRPGLQIRPRCLSRNNL